MKVKDSQLQKIRQLYKKLTEGKKVDGEFEARLQGTGTTSGSAPLAGPEATSSRTNYGDLHQAIERRTYEFAVRAVAQAPDVRADRVAEIEARIKAGTYSVDPDKVAEAMLDSGVFEDL